VCVEVKTRRSLAFGNPQDAVTDRKLHRIWDVAADFVRSRAYRDPQIRIDVIAILFHHGDYRIEHLVDVHGSL
jgi:putative endonuclease